MADFNIAFGITMQIEGGYANDPHDSGQETLSGISRKNFPQWSGWNVVDSHRNDPSFPSNLKDDPTLPPLIRAFYKQNFWNCFMGDDIADQKIANELFDTGVNCGSGVAAIFLQRALNVASRAFRDYPQLPLDGKIGPKTLSVLNAHRNPALVLKLLNVLQGAKYIDICEHRPDQEIFLTSWMSRVSL